MIGIRINSRREWRRRSGLVMALVSILIGLVGLWGWFYDIELFKIVLPGAASMKANTAIGILLCGFALMLMILAEDRPKIRIYSRIFGGLAGLLGLVTLVQYLLAADFGIDQLFFTESLSDVSARSPGRMSPSSALCFLLMGASLGLKGNTRRISASRFSAQVTLGIALLTVVGYVVGTSLLLGMASYTQMAVHTATAFGLLGGGFLLASMGQAQSDEVLAQQLEGRKTLLRLGTLGLTVTLVVVTFAVLIHEHNRVDLSADIHQELEYVSHYKSEQIRNWVKERLGNGKLVQSNVAVARVLADPGDDRSRAELQRWMEGLVVAYDYRAVILFDAEGTIQLSAATDPEAVRLIDGDTYHDHHSETEVTMTRLHRSSLDPQIHLSVTVPIIGADGGPRLGLLLMMIAPEKFLFPLISEWPSPSATAETVIFRREGEEILFLSKLRHRPDAALNLRLPVGHPGLPEAMALKVRSGTAIEGLDYRGVPVLAVSEAIEGTPWYMVTKVDRAEAYASFRVQTRTLLAMTSMVVVIAACGIFLIWRNEQQALVNQQFADAEKARQESLRRNQELGQRVAERTKDLENAIKELESFSYSVSHDLRAPLRAIDGWGQVLLEDYAEALGEGGRESLGRLRAAAQRMGDLIDSLLQLSRANRGPLKRITVSPNRLIEEARLDLANSITLNLAEFKVHPLPDFEVAPDLITQVFANLIGNALKFSSREAHPLVEIGGEKREDGELVFWVKDNGVGFDPRYSHKLFEAFQRLHSAAEFSGTGIGLALAHRIILRHGGRIWAESEVGRGATFFFTVSGAPAAPLHHSAIQTPPSENEN